MALLEDRVSFHLTNGIQALDVLKWHIMVQLLFVSDDSGEDSDDGELFESHSDNGAGLSSGGRVGKKKIKAVGGKAVAKSKKIPGKLKKAFL